MHIIISRLLTLHAQEWSKFGGTKFVENVHYSHVELPVLKEIYLDPLNEVLVIDEINFHMKIEHSDKFYDIVWFWE